MNQLLITSADLKVHRFYIDECRLELAIGKAGERNRTMGIARLDQELYVADNYSVRRFEKDGGEWCCKAEVKVVGQPGLHHIMTLGGNLYIADTHLGGFHIVSPSLGFKHFVSINGKWTNAVHYYKGHFYVCDAQMPDKETGSGVIVLDVNFKEVDRFCCGWQGHGFKFIDDKKHMLASAGMITGIKHPRMGGLIVEDEFVYTYGRELFCKEFIKHDDKFFIFGGTTTARENRGKSGGVIVILDENYEFIDKLFYEGIGELVGCAVE